MHADAGGRQAWELAAESIVVKIRWFGVAMGYVLVQSRTGLHNPDGWPGPEVGWTLDRKFWGQGYATEAGRAAIAYAFDVLGWEHIISVIHPENLRSIRVAERLGMRYERDAEVMNGIKVVQIFGPKHSQT